MKQGNRPCVKLLFRHCDPGRSPGEAIQQTLVLLDCFVADAPRNDRSNILHSLTAHAAGMAIEDMDEGKALDITPDIMKTSRQLGRGLVVQWGRGT